MYNKKIRKTLWFLFDLNIIMSMITEMNWDPQSPAVTIMINQT